MSFLSVVCISASQFECNRPERPKGKTGHSVGTGTRGPGVVEQVFARDVEKVIACAHDVAAVPAEGGEQVLHLGGDRLLRAAAQDVVLVQAADERQPRAERRLDRGTIPGAMSPPIPGGERVSETSQPLRRIWGMMAFIPPQV